MTPYDQLKQVIQAANPEIMELKFGCEVIYLRQLCKYLHYIEGWFHVMLPPNYDKGILQVTNPKLKILGRPIRLADVLLAFRETPGLKALKAPIGKDDFEWTIYMIAVQWNPHDDNLDHQSEETKQLLIKLLVPWIYQSNEAIANREFIGNIYENPDILNDNNPRPAEGV